MVLPLGIREQAGKGYGPIEETVSCNTQFGGVITPAMTLQAPRILVENRCPSSMSCRDKERYASSVGARAVIEGYCTGPYSRLSPGGVAGSGPAGQRRHRHG